ncbi:MAG: ABC transporter substrate-binding protein [Defluviitaleaceae bacterium]|nr:ABC transporter substrate-binding protein [Defluviitaleaceae bacterium]
MKNKFKKLFLSFLAATSLFLVACGTGVNPATSGGIEVFPEDQDRILRIASFTNEALVLATAFAGENPDIEIDFTEITMQGGEYQNWLMPLLALGGDVPDVIFLEAEFIRQFVESPFLGNMNSLLPYVDYVDTFPFVVEAGMHNGEARAFSFQATPGVMYFRRSMAREYFGTDDPSFIQELFSTPESTLDAGRVIRDASGGTTFLVSSANEFFRGFAAGRRDPWVVDNTLTIDPLMMYFIDFARILNEENLQAQVDQWSGEWFQGMDDNLINAHGQPIRIFSYLLPTWGLTYVLMDNAPSTFGDFGVIESPLPYHWGGTWIAVTRDARNPNLAREFVRWATLNEVTLERWATGYFSNEFLRAIDPSLPSDLGRGPGDFVSSRNVVNRISNYFEDTDAYNFLGGQNPYEIFGQLAPNVSLRLMQGTDAAIGDEWQDAVGAYLEGQIGSVQELLQSFRNAVRVILPDLNIN